MGRPREHGTETREALLSAAGALLQAEGPAAVTVRRLADDVGTTTRAVYSLFGDKTGLMKALYYEAAEVMRRHHEAVPVGDDPVADIRLLALAYRAAALEQPNLYWLFIGSVDHRYMDAETVALAYRSLESVLIRIRSAIEAGRFPPRDPFDVGRQLWALVHGLASLELKGFLGEAAQDPETGAKEGHRIWLEAITTMLDGLQTAAARSRQ
jgi:AcrR family transcriptional regulator